MNGVHDMGGMHGMGPIDAKPEEPVFHAEWERRTLALLFASGSESLASDLDGDAIPDAYDNCSALPSLVQCDADRDGYGNPCDADFDQNGIARFARARHCAPRTRTTPSGFTATTAILVAAKALGAVAGELVRYTDSGEVTRDTAQVVAYAGLLLR